MSDHMPSLNCPKCGRVMRYVESKTDPQMHVCECPEHGLFHFGPKTDLTEGLPPWKVRREKRLFSRRRHTVSIAGLWRGSQNSFKARNGQTSRKSLPPWTYGARALKGLVFCLR